MFNDTHLGEPSLSIAGFRLWVHSRQFPEAQDYWDGNWLNVTAQCAASGAIVRVNGSILMVTDIEEWGNQCALIHQSLQGEAKLEPIEPELRITIQGEERR